MGFNSGFKGLINFTLLTDMWRDFLDVEKGSVSIIYYGFLP